MAETKKTYKEKTRDEKDTRGKGMPERSADTSSPTPGSMSEGKLTNERHSRQRTRTPHSKTFITGSDDDGQAV